MSTLYVLLPVTHEHRNVNWEWNGRAFDRWPCGSWKRSACKDVERAFASRKWSRRPIGARNTRLHKGSTFSMAHNLRQMLHLRPHNRFEDLDRVYLVGGGTHPGSGLPVIFESARITAGCCSKI
jgi:phytoene desaturase